MNYDIPSIDLSQLGHLSFFAYFLSKHYHHPFEGDEIGIPLGCPHFLNVLWGGLRRGRYRFTFGQNGDPFT